MSKKSGKTLTEKAGKTVGGIWQGLLSALRVATIALGIAALGIVIYYTVKAGQWIWNWKL